MRPCRTHTRRAVRGTAAMLLTCSLLTAQAWAAKITPSTTSVTLASSQQTFTVDVALSEETAFAGAEFGLDLPAGVTLTGVEFLDKAVQDANHSPEVTVEDRTFFGFYTAENTFSGDIKVARPDVFVHRRRRGSHSARLVQGRYRAGGRLNQRRHHFRAVYRPNHPQERLFFGRRFFQHQTGTDCGRRRQRCAVERL